MDRYVYMLSDAGVPFYVGKGTHANNYTDKYRRPQYHMLEASKPTSEQTNKLNCAYINKILARGDEVNIAIIADNLTEDEALQLETELIQQFGRLAYGGTLTNLVAEQNKCATDTRKRPVYAFSTSGELKHTFLSIKEAAKDVACSAGNIVWCCKGKYKTAGGFVWSYTNVFPGFVLAANSNAQQIDCYLPSGDFVCTYPTITQAAQITGIDQSSISNSIRQITQVAAGGFIWVHHGRPFTLRDKRTAGKPKKSVGQYAADGNLIKTHTSIKQAERDTGILIAGISRCCRNEQHTAGGFIWKFTDSESNQ